MATPAGQSLGSQSSAPSSDQKSSMFYLKVPHSQIMTQVIGYMLLFSLVIIFITEILIIRDTSNLTSAFKRLRTAGDTGRSLVVFEYILWFLVGPFVLLITTRLHQRIFIGLGNLAYVAAGVATLLVGIFYRLTGIDRLFLSPSDPNVRKSFWSSFFSNDMDPSVEKVISLLKTASFVIMAVFIGLGVLFTFASLNTNLLYYLFPTTKGATTQFAKFFIDIFVLPFILMIPVLLRIVYVNRIVGRKVLWRRSILIWFLFFVAPTIVFMMFFSLLHVLDDYTIDIKLSQLTQKIKSGDEALKPKIRKTVIDRLVRQSRLSLVEGEPFTNYAKAHETVSGDIASLQPDFTSKVSSYLLNNTKSNLDQLENYNSMVVQDERGKKTGKIIINVCQELMPPIADYVPFQQSQKGALQLLPTATVVSTGSLPPASAAPAPASAPPGPPPPPPSDWQELTDPKTGSTYYYNLRTKTATWDKPQQLKTPQG